MVINLGVVFLARLQTNLTLSCDKKRSKKNVIVNKLGEYNERNQIPHEHK